MNTIKLRAKFSRRTAAESIRDFHEKMKEREGREVKVEEDGGD